MIQVIDYNNGIFGIVQNENYNSIDLKIGDVEFKLPKDKLCTLAEMPSEILQKKTVPAAVTHYADLEGNTLSWDDHIAEITRLNANMVWDDDGDSKIWDTREDKENYEAFISRWKGVYSEPVVEWNPVDFEVIKKQYIPEQYAKYITSSIIVGSTTNYHQQAYKAICYYTSNPAQMIRDIAEKLGFSISSSENETKGKRIFIYTRSGGDSTVQFSKVDGNYFNVPESDRKKYGSRSGTFEACVAKYEFEYNQLYDFLLGVANKLDHPTLSPEERTELASTVDAAMGHWNKIDPMKSSRDQYRYLGSKLTEIKKKLLLIPMMLLLLMVGCNYPHDGKLVKMDDGKVYRLRKSTGDNSYMLDLVDTSGYWLIER